MSEFSADLRAPFQKGTTARATLLDLVPKVDRVDSYAQSKYKTQLEPIRKGTDDSRQSQRNVGQACHGAIKNWLMVHEQANDPEFLNDIIDECTNSLNALGQCSSKSKAIPEQIEQLCTHMASLKTSLEGTIKEKDKVIDAQLDDATTGVNKLSAEVDQIDAQLVELRKKVKQGSIGKLVESTKNLAGNLGSSGSKPPTTAGTDDGKDDDEQVALKKQIKELEDRRAQVQTQLETARERKRQAVALSDQRTTAKNEDPIGSANKAHTDCLSWRTQSENLTALFGALERGITAYQRAFKAQKDGPSAANKKALADEIKKVDGYVPKLKAVQAALQDGAYNE